MSDKTGYLVYPVSGGLVRVEMHNHDDTPHYTALLLDSNEAMALSRAVADAALNAGKVDLRAPTDAQMALDLTPAQRHHT